MGWENSKDKKPFVGLWAIGYKKGSSIYAKATSLLAILLFTTFLQRRQHVCHSVRRNSLSFFSKI